VQLYYRQRALLAHTLSFRPFILPHPSSVFLSYCTTCRHVLLLDPVIATGNSVRRALDILIKDKGVPEERILLVTLIVAPEGVRNLCEAFPRECFLFF
jgi:uracil phosphoribosyltransferase